MLLCSCVSDPNSGTPPLAVDLSALKTCEKILQAVPPPAVTAKTAAGLAFLKDDAALLTANGRLASGRACVADTRMRYANPGR